MEWRIAIFNAGIGIKMRGVPGGIARGSFFVMVDSHRSMPRTTSPADREWCEQVI
ncbi:MULTISPECIES: hypothetical protein [Bacillales]|uniref:hypothetical protein n=1 Tax=Bacillales TaxID=1385 RepID=UPI0016512069|nr:MULTISPECIES: hypothetical protein [Paenibacillus]MCM3261577.1 hypothetical protein [Paenibacillus lautus]